MDTDLRSIGGSPSGGANRAPATLCRTSISAHRWREWLGWRCTVGGVIGRGDGSGDMLADDRLIIEARVQPQHADNITVGQQADVQFTALKEGQPAAAWRGALCIGRPPGRWPYRRILLFRRILVADEEVERLGDQQPQLGMPADIGDQDRRATSAPAFSQPLLDSLERRRRSTV